MMIVVDLILLFISLALAGIGVITVLNAITLPRLGQGIDGGQIAAGLDLSITSSRISVLVPIRNEATVIAETVKSLLDQDDPNFEILLLDDESTDGSAELARQAGGGDPRLRILPGKPLPDGWLGKNWACAQLAEAARGEILVFTDADVHWIAHQHPRPGALRILRRAIEQTGMDVYTVWPTQITVTWPERLVVPMMALATVGYLSFSAVQRLPWASLSAVYGQCLVFRRRGYERIGGHAAVKQDIVEDVGLIRLAKKQGLKLRMVDAAGQITCRMYRDWSSVRDGFAKNILAGHGGVIPLLLSAVFHWLVFVFPWVWSLIGWLGGVDNRYPSLALTLAAIGLAVRALTAKVTLQRAGDAFLMPLSIVLMTLIAGRALHWRWFGGAEWKGRALDTR
jgi:chlorobactene glucosyltransferase